MAAAALSATLVGCSLLVDLSGTTGGTDAGPGAQGDRSRAEASDEGPGADASGDRDEAGQGGSEAGTAGDSSAAGRSYPAGSWCDGNAPTAFFCDDFDDGPLGARWTGATLQVSGAATLSSVNERSAPYGLDIACPSLMPSTFLTEALTEAIPAASRIAVGFDFEPLTFSAGGVDTALYLATLAQGPGTPRWAIQFRAGTSLTDLQEQVILASGSIKRGTGQWESPTLVPAGTWTRVEIDVDFATAPATVALLLAGQRVAMGTLDPSWARAPATLYLGDWYIPSEPAFHVAYDNVTVTLQP
jgi:hypothetical protein